MNDSSIVYGECTYAVHVLFLECCLILTTVRVCVSVCVSVCLSQGMVPSLGSVGWPITVFPYRDTGAGQPQAIWQQSLVYWLASHIWTSVHTTVTSLETED